MNELSNKAKSIAEILEALKDEDHITADRLPDILSEVFDGSDNINFYPGFASDACYNFALFISLQSGPFKKDGRQRVSHLDCNEAMQSIVQHMQGSCIYKTQTALFITDNWDVSAFDQWKNNLVQINRDAQLEIYLKVANTVTPIPL